MVIFAGLLAGWSLMAQPAGGQFFVGGNFNLYTTTDKSKAGGTTENNGTETFITILPMAGYFLSDRIAVGARAGLDAYIQKYPGEDPDKYSSVIFVINPFARYYLISGTGGLFAEAFLNAGFGTDKTFYEATTVSANTLNFSIGVAPGVYYYVTKKLALESKFGWFGFETDVNKQDNDTKDIQSTFGLMLSPDFIIFGLTFTL